VTGAGNDGELGLMSGVNAGRDSKKKILRDGEWKSQENAKGRPKTQFETDLRSR